MSQREAGAGDSLVAKSAVQGQPSTPAKHFAVPPRVAGGVVASGQSTGLSQGPTPSAVTNAEKKSRG